MTVLWGCSVEPSLVEDAAIARDLASYDLICARESISYEALSRVNTSTVLVSDPAFTLERCDAPLPDGWVEGKMIGINVSPLIFGYAESSDVVRAAYRELITHILETTDCSVALIPHVVTSGNDDRVPLRELEAEFCDTGRVLLVDDCGCRELKGYIARCRAFIGARTHATIAAYSSCVPTLVLGYSVKSRGIARDIFGTEDGYVLPVQSLTEKTALARAFDTIMTREDEIRAHLEAVMPEYIERARTGAAAVRKLQEAAR